MRKELSWISPLRVGIIYAAIFAVMWVVASIIRMIFGGMMDGIGGAGMMAGGDIAGIFLVGLVMSVVSSFIAGVIGAFIYNIVAGTVGGIVIELKDA